MKDFLNKNRRRIIGIGSLLLLFLGIFKGLPVPVLIGIPTAAVIVLTFETELFGGTSK
jgi:hypothetical protein